MAYIDIMGYIAGALVVASLLPQVIKSWKTKSTKDISILRYTLYEIVGLIGVINFYRKYEIDCSAREKQLCKLIQRL